jgi:ACS family glucarate transporter-like MFS transporter
VYSVYLYLSWLPDYLQTARHLSIMKSGVFTAVPFFVGAAVIVLTNWIGDRILTPETMRTGSRRIVVVTCLTLCALGMAIPFVDSLALLVVLTIFPISFGGTASATNAALCSDLLRSPLDSGRAFAFMVLGGNVFGLLAPIVTGYIVQATGSFASAFILAGALSLIGATVSFTLTRHTLGEASPVAVGMARAAG